MISIGVWNFVTSWVIKLIIIRNFLSMFLFAVDFQMLKSVDLTARFAQTLAKDISWITYLVSWKIKCMDRNFWGPHCRTIVLPQNLSCQMYLDLLETTIDSELSAVIERIYHYPADRRCTSLCYVRKGFSKCYIFSSRDWKKRHHWMAGAFLWFVTGRFFLLGIF